MLEIIRVTSLEMEHYSILNIRMKLLIKCLICKSSQDQINQILNGLTQKNIDTTPRNYQILKPNLTKTKQGQ